MAFTPVVISLPQSWIDPMQTLPSDYSPGQRADAVTRMGGVKAGIGVMFPEPDRHDPK
jgi:hypothetical protein